MSSQNKRPMARRILLCTAIVLLEAVLFWCIVAYTPVRTLIPGYPDATTRQQAVENGIKIDSLENVVSNLETYTRDLVRQLGAEEQNN